MTDFDRDHAYALADYGLARRGWDAAGSLSQLAKVKGRSADDVAMAWVRFCADDNARTPGAFPNLSGPHWSEKVAPPATPSPPKPHEACKECGRALHAADRVCDRPTVRPLASVPPSVAYLNLRRPSGRQTTPEQGDAS